MPHSAIEGHNAAVNKVKMHKAGFVQDKGRILSQEEVEDVKLTPPDQITRKCWVTGAYYWGER
jgi:hypothetical protein